MWGSPGDSVVKNPPADSGDAGDMVPSLSWEDLLEKGMQPTLVFLPGKSHGQRSLVGSGLWDCVRVGRNLVIKQQQEWHMKGQYFVVKVPEAAKS